MIKVNREQKNVEPPYFPDGKIKAYADTAYMAKIYIGWAKKLNVKLDLYITFSQQKHAFNFDCSLNSMHQLLPDILSYMPTRLRNKFGMRRFLQACLSDQSNFSILHDYGKVEECQNLKSLNMNVFAVPHTMNIENYEDKHFAETSDCGISLLVQSNQSGTYFKQLGFHEIIECGRIDWADIAPPKIVKNQAGYELLLLPKRHLGILDAILFAHLVKKMKSNGSKVQCITHPNERLWGVVAYFFTCILLGVRLSSGGVSGLKRIIYIKRVWCMYSDFEITKASQIEKVFVRIVHKDAQLKRFLPKGVEKHEQIWIK